MDFFQLGKSIVIIGGVIVLSGLILCLVGKIGLSIGNLPGDIHIKKENFSFHFPILTSIIASIILTIVLNIILLFFSRK